MKKRLLKCGLALAVLLLLGFFAPSLYWQIVGRWHGEAFYAGRPTSCWRELAKEQRSRPLSLPVAGGFQPPTKTWRETLEDWKEKWWPKDQITWDRLANDSRAAPMLRALARDDDVVVREAALTALCECGDKDDLPALLAYLKNGEDSATQIAICNFLPKIGGVDVLPTLCAWFSEDEQSAKRAARAIRYYEHHAEPAIPLLIKSLAHDNGLHVAYALAEIGDKALEQLREPLAAQAPRLRLRATIAVNAIRGAEQQRIALLTERLKDSDREIRHQAFGGLARMPESLDLACVLLRVHNTYPEKIVRQHALLSLQMPKHGPLYGFVPAREVLERWIERARTAQHAELLSEAEKALASLEPSP